MNTTSSCSVKLHLKMIYVFPLSTGKKYIYDGKNKAQSVVSCLQHHIYCRISTIV